MLALSVVVPALLGYLQEVCRARPSELELLHRRYHSVRREDLRKVQLSRQEAVAQPDPAGGVPERDVLQL